MKTIVKIIVLTFILFISYLASLLLVGLAHSQTLNHTILALLTVSLLNTMVMSNFVILSRLSGWRLVLVVFLVFYGITTFLSQIETIVFLKYLVDIVPVDIIPKLFLQGAIIASIFSFSAVAIYGKLKDEVFQDMELLMTKKELFLKLILVAVVYTIIYFLFGMFIFVPLAGKALQEYYGNLQLPIWIIPFQMFRGLIWATLALIVIKTMKSKWNGLTVALLFSVLMSSLLLISNEFMPDRIRFAHFVEIA